MDPTKQAVAIYNAIARAYAERFSSPSTHLDEFLALLPKGGRVLDVGCGAGVDAGYMTSKGFAVTGVDLSENMVALARKNYQGIDFRVADMRKVRLASFDGILAAYSLIHLSKKEVPGVLKKFFRLLKKGGIVFLVAFTGEPKERWLPEPMLPGKKIFVDVFSREELCGLLERAGFRVLRSAQQKIEKEGEFPDKELMVLGKK